jgi:hypothetical protein
MTAEQEAEIGRASKNQDEFSGSTNGTTTKDSAEGAEQAAKDMAAWRAHHKREGLLVGREEE